MQKVKVNRYVTGKRSVNGNTVVALSTYIVYSLHNANVHV